MRTKVVGFLTLCLTAALAAPAAAGDGEGADRAAPAGMRVYVDPETGELTAPPAGRRNSEDAPAMLQGMPADEELVEEVNPAGGYTVDLKRRFGGVARAVAAPSGADVECDAGEQPAVK